MCTPKLIQKEDLLHNPGKFYNLPLSNIFQVFGIKDDTCYSYAIQLWVRNNLTNWDAVEQISELCLITDPECKLSQEEIVEVYKMPEDSEPKKLFKNILSMLMYLAGLVEALRYKEVWYVKNWGTSWTKRMPNGRNIQDSLEGSKDIIAKEQIKYARRTSKYLKEEMIKYQKQISITAVDVIPVVSWQELNSDIKNIPPVASTDILVEEEEIPLSVMKRLKRGNSNIIEDPHWPQNDAVDKELCGEIISQDDFYLEI